MGRVKLVAANWKMHKTVAEARRFVADLRGQLPDPGPVQGLICPSFTALAPTVDALAGTPYLLGGQDLHWDTAGAYTGEVSGLQLKDLGCSFVIVGHSERRQFFGETDYLVNRKIHSAFLHGLTPILCVGETEADRGLGRTEETVVRQLKIGLSGLNPEQAKTMVIAYEPVWAIGTGNAATGADAQELAHAIRQHLIETFGREAAEGARIQYGGSVKPANVAEFASQPDIDGALVGGASLEPASFAALIRNWGASIY